MNHVIRPFLLLSAVGLIASLIVHLSALLNIPNAFGHYAWVLHAGIFVVWFPAVLVMCTTTNRVQTKDIWKAALRGCPRWMRLMVVSFQQGCMKP